MIRCSSLGMKVCPTSSPGTTGRSEHKEGRPESVIGTEVPEYSRIPWPLSALAWPWVFLRQLCGAR